jgi:hypothetical protein
MVPGLRPKWTAKEMEELKKTAGIIDSMLAQESRRALAENEKEIRNFIYEALLIRHNGQDDESLFRWRLSDDSQMKMAIRFLTDKNIYTVMLSPRTAKTPKGTRRK